MWGGLYHDGSRWRIDTYRNRLAPHEDSGEVAEAFILAHRGHVLGLIEGGTIDVSEESHGEIASLDNLASLLAMHPGDELDEADRLAEPSDLLRGLLGAGDAG